MYSVAQRLYMVLFWTLLHCVSPHWSEKMCVHACQCTKCTTLHCTLIREGVVCAWGTMESWLGSSSHLTHHYYCTITIIPFVIIFAHYQKLPTYVQPPLLNLSKNASILESTLKKDLKVFPENWKTKDIVKRSTKGPANQRAQKIAFPGVRMAIYLA